VLCLDEGTVTGAADAYWRMTGKPAATLLHCGPGLANGLANLHNAKRAFSGIVNIVGDQATYHRPLDAPLTADVEGWAAPVSGFVRRTMKAADVGRDAAAAITAANTYPGQIATLILPADTAWDDGGVIASAEAPEPPVFRDEAVTKAAEILRNGEPTMLLIGGAALMQTPLHTAAAIAAATGAKMLAPVSPARIERGSGRVPIMRVPYPVDLALDSLAGLKNLILIGTTAPVAFFAYPGKPGYLYPPDCRVHVLARVDEDAVAAINALAETLGIPAEPPTAATAPTLAEPPTGNITPEKLAQTLAALMPEQTIIVDEAISYGRGFYPYTFNAPPHDWLQLTGGAIGAGLPMATGAAIACPNRRVINLQADGSAMYTNQALWTQARENLNITTIILNNRKYAILLAELANVGANPGPTALNMLTLDNPLINWTQLAESMGVPATTATTMDELNTALQNSLSQTGPFLIELMV
jgi:acetolactate synthase-1/2/3 large subunit